MSLKAVRTYVSAARKKTIMECNRMERLLLLGSCKQDLANFITSGSVLTDNTRSSVCHFNLDEKGSFNEWLRKILYLGSFFEYWRFERDKLINYLRLKGHSLVVNDLLTFRDNANI
jgi:hypothetical protein